MDWLTRRQAYSSACLKHAADFTRAPAASTFKRDPDYRAIVANDLRDLTTTTAFLEWHQARGPVKSIAARVAMNDRYGAPVLHQIGGHQWSTGSLRYLQVADEIGSQAAIVEIGGGYGGQRLLCPDVRDYTIVDVAEALVLAEAYLAPSGLPTTFVEVGQPITVPEGAFVLSDWALSEVPADVCRDLIDRIVARCAAGRFTVAVAAVDRLVAALGPHFASITSELESPRTSHHDNRVIRCSGRPTAAPIRRVLKEPARPETIRRLTGLLEARTPFAFSRWGDGEWSAVLGRGHANCDQQPYADGLRTALAEVLRDEPPYLLGLQPMAVRRFGPEIAAWLERHGRWPAWLNADVWHQLSRKGALDTVIDLLRDRPVLLVGPAYLQALDARVPLVGHVDVPTVDAYAGLEAIQTDLADQLSRLGPGGVVALSAGMVTNVIIHEYCGRRPTRTSPATTTWIDFGAVWEPYVGRTNRTYHAEIVRRLERP